VFEESFSFLKHAKRKGIPVVVHGHSTKEDFLNSFNFSKYIKHWFYAKLKNMYSNADVIITPSNYSKMLLGKLWIYQVSNQSFKQWNRFERV